MAWLQVHQSLATHRKTLLAAKRLAVPRAQVVGHLLLLWLWAIDNAPDGSLEDLEADILADAAMWPDDPDRFIEVLVSVGFLDQTERGYLIHDWQDYAGKLLHRRELNAQRARQWRENKPERIPNAYATHSESARDVAREEKSREEKIKIQPAVGAKNAPPAPQEPASAPIPKPKSESDAKRRQMFMVLLNACGYDRNHLTKPEQGELNAAVKALLEAGYGPPDVDAMARNWYGHFEDCSMTPSAIVKHASRLMRPAERSGNGRASADTDIAKGKYASLSQ